MPNEINWSAYPSATSYLTTELNSLADGARKLGAAIDNTSNGDMYMDIEFYVAAQGSARAADAVINIWIVPSIDGTNYVYGSDSLDPPANTFVAAMPLDATTTARYIGVTHILCPAGKFKLQFRNDTGQTLAASGNTAKYTLYNEEVQ